MQCLNLRKIGQLLDNSIDNSHIKDGVITPKKFEQELEMKILVLEDGSRFTIRKDKEE